VKRAIALLVASGLLTKEGSDDRAANSYRLGSAVTVAMEAPTSDTAVEDDLDLDPHPAPEHSNSAIQLAARFTELLAQPKKHGSVHQRWPETFDTMLQDNAHSDLLAAMEWVFTGGDTYGWATFIRTTANDPADYFSEKIGTILAAKAHPTMARTSDRDRNAPAPHSPVSDLLAASTI